MDIEKKEAIILQKIWYTFKYRYPHIARIIHPIVFGKKIYCWGCKHLDNNILNIDEFLEVKKLQMTNDKTIIKTKQKNKVKLYSFCWMHLYFNCPGGCDRKTQNYFIGLDKNSNPSQKYRIYDGHTYIINTDKYQEPLYVSKNGYYIPKYERVLLVNGKYHGLVNGFSSKEDELLFNYGYNIRTINGCNLLHSLDNNNDFSNYGDMDKRPICEHYKHTKGQCHYITKKEEKLTPEQKYKFIINKLKEKAKKEKLNTQIESKLKLKTSTNYETRLAIKRGCKIYKT